MNYIISQSRDHRDVATISTIIKDELLSDWDKDYHKVLAVMSKIFDDNPSIEHLATVFTIYDTGLVIKAAIINNDHFSNVREHFEKNGFKYETL